MWSVLVFVAAAARRNEILPRATQEAMGIVWKGNWTPGHHSHDALRLQLETFPEELDWCDKDGVSYCTINRNQHIPQYCGACWAFGALSALADRVKIVRQARGIDILPSVQHLLNCGGPKGVADEPYFSAGTCSGGSPDGVYQWIFFQQTEVTPGSGISYDSAQPYLACSADSSEGFCRHVDTSCAPVNRARTCGSFGAEGGPCTALSHYPNLTISAYGAITGAEAMKAEILSRGPIACGVDSEPLLNYEHGVLTAPGKEISHIVSVVGWGRDGATEYWRVRNSWGEYWGEMGHVRVAFGSIFIEQDCVWAVPAAFTAPEFANQVHCHEGGDNCKVKNTSQPIGLYV